MAMNEKPKCPLIGSDGNIFCLLGSETDQTTEDEENIEIHTDLFDKKGGTSA